MDITQMRMMLVLAECKSMTTTAKKLHVTQPALTYQLKTIENELGFKVFNRSRTGSTLTREGAFFCSELSAAAPAAAINANVAERSAKVFGISRVERDDLVSAFPPEGWTVGDVAVVARECFA